MSEISKTIALIGLLMPFGAVALGVGDIRSNSSLNQPLNAEIPLILSGGDNLGNIQVRLARPEVFEKAGVDRLHTLTQLQFKPITKPDGRHAIQVTSRNAIQETFLDFLVEVESPQGTVLREFTLLLDPSRSLSQVSSPRGPSISYDQPYPSDHNWGESHYDESASYDRPGRSARTHYPSHGSSNVTPPIQLTGETYGPVRRRERLIDIAGRIQRPPTVTREQMATGLFLANPRAFKRTMNSLRAGSMLRIPTEEYLTQINTGEANHTIDKRAAHLPSDWEADKSIDASARTGGGAVTEVSSRIPSALKKENEELREQLSQLEQRLEEAQRMLELKNAELATLHSHEASKPPAMAEASNPAEPLLQANPSAIESSQSAQTGSLPLEVKAPEPAIPAQPRPSVPESKLAPAPPPKPAPAVPTPTRAESPDSMESLMAPEFWQASGALTALGLAAWLYRRRRNSAESIENPTDSTTPSKADEVTEPPLPTPYVPSATAERETSNAPAESPISTDVLDPLWETDVYLRYGRFNQAEALMRETIRNEPERDDLKQKLFEVLHLANKTEAFTEYFRELQSYKPDLDSEFWLPIQTFRPELFPIIAAPLSDSPQDVIHSEIQSAPDTIIIKEAELFPASTQVEPLMGDADLDNTDFTAELRALEEASTRLGPQQVSDEPITLKSNLDSDYEKPETGLPTTSTAIEDLVSELVATAQPEVAMPGPDKESLIDSDDTGFEEELKALSAQHHHEEQEAISPAQPPLTQAINDPEEIDSAESTQEIDNLMAYDTSELNLRFDQLHESEASNEVQLNNLISFDISDLDATLAAVSFKAGIKEPEPEKLAHSLNNIEIDALFTDIELPHMAASNNSFGLLDFELELIDPAASTISERSGTSESLESQAMTGTTNLNKRIAEARHLAERNEKSAARSILQEVLEGGNSDQKAAAEDLLNEMAKVHLSLVPPPSRKVS